MTDITDLAKEIIKHYKLMANTTGAAYDDARFEFTKLSKELAQMVVDQEYAKRASRAIELEQARQEQKEKDAQIVIEMVNIKIQRR